MPVKNRNLAIAAGCLMLMGIILYGYWNFMYRPLQEQIVADRAKLDKLTNDLAAAEAVAAKLSTIQAEMASLQVEVAELEKQLPKGRELPSLIRLLTHRAEGHGLALSNIAPQKPVSKGLYDEILYNITLSSSYHGLGRFLTAMGKGERLFAARDLTLTGNTSKTEPDKTINATFKLVSFKYRE